jgi:ELWxxDGT repeat protein
LNPINPLAGRVNNADRVDYYRVTAEAGDYLFSTSGLQGKAHIEIFDSSKNRIATFNSNASHPNEKFLQAFDGGTYFIKFTQSTPGSTANYSVTAQKQTDRVSNSVNTPTSLALTTSLTNLKSNYVFEGGKDSPVDFYRFNVENRGFLTVELRNMFGNLDVQLQRVTDSGLTEGRIFDSPSLSPVGTYGQGSEVFGGTLSEGEYILRVFAPMGSVGSTYDLFASLSPRNDQPSITQDINFGSNGSSARNLVEAGGFAFFTANDGRKDALWRSNGTLDGTTKIREFESIGGTAISTGNAVYFLADDGTTGSELWRSDVSGNVTLVANLAGNGNGITINQIAAVGDTVFFSTTYDREGITQRKLYSTTGTGVTAISGINAASVSNMVALEGDQGNFGASGLAKVLQLRSI